MQCARTTDMDGPTMGGRWHAMCWDVLGWAVRRRCGRERRWKFNKVLVCQLLGHTVQVIQQSGGGSKEDENVLTTMC